jgi:hypothetical protein
MARYRFGAQNGSLRGKAQRRAPANDPYQTTLERDYQRVLIAIQSMWGYPELNVYFYKLTMDDRGQRAGFPQDVWDDIDLLWSLHQTIVPDTSPPHGP